MMPRRQTLSNASAPSKPPILSRTTTATTSTGQIPVSKFASCFQAILKGTEKPAPYNAADPERFYFDLFCLGVDKPYLLSLASEIPENLLVESGPIKVDRTFVSDEKAVTDVYRTMSSGQHSRIVLLCREVHQDERHGRPKTA